MGIYFTVLNGYTKAFKYFEYLLSVAPKFFLRIAKAFRCAEVVYFTEFHYVL